MRVCRIKYLERLYACQLAFVKRLLLLPVRHFGGPMFNLRYVPDVMERKTIYGAHNGCIMLLEYSIQATERRLLSSRLFIPPNCGGQRHEISKDNRVSTGIPNLQIISSSPANFSGFCTDSITSLCQLLNTGLVKDSLVPEALDMGIPVILHVTSSFND